MNLLTDLVVGAVLTSAFIFAPLLVAIGSIANIRDKGAGAWTHAVSGVTLAVGIVWLTGGIVLVGWYDEFFKAHS